jgi:hypothetical protein
VLVVAHGTGHGIKLGIHPKPPTTPSQEKCTFHVLIKRRIVNLQNAEVIAEVAMLLLQTQCLTAEAGRANPNAQMRQFNKRVLLCSGTAV